MPLMPAHVLLVPVQTRFPPSAKIIPLTLRLVFTDVVAPAIERAAIEDVAYASVDVAM